MIKFSPGPPVSSTNKTDCNDITETVLKVALNTIKHIFSIGCHLGWSSDQSDRFENEENLSNITTKLGLYWLSSFRE